MELNSETWNMSPENIVLGDVAFGLTKSDAGLPSYAFFSKSALQARLEPLSLPVYGCGKRYGRWNLGN